MKYFNIPGINRAISLIREGQDTNEHVTSRATSAMIKHYIKDRDDLYSTPEQIQEFTRKKPDYVIEKLIPTAPYFKPHAFVEVKSLVNSNIIDILDQLYDTILYAIDSHGGTYSCFMIAMKGTKIAFYTYHNFHTLLDDYGISHYKGFIPLNYNIPINLYSRINSEATPEMYESYINSRSYFNTEATVLHGNGALQIRGLSHPHVMDLVNDYHKDDIHNM